MREVKDRCHARVEGLERASVVAHVYVLCGVAGREGRAYAEEVIHESPVGADSSQGGLPGVPVCVDEAGHDHSAGSVDDLGVD
jgi:hypothetical protein